MCLFQTEFNALLNKNKLIDYSEWQNIVIDHTGTFRQSQLSELRNAIPGGYAFSGVYVYTYLKNKKKHVWYIGKSKELPKRLYNHYKECHRKAGISDWPVFWASNKCKMKVYYKEIVDENPAISEAMRIIVERWLIATYQPEAIEFMQMKKKQKMKSRK